MTDVSNWLAEPTPQTAPYFEAAKSGTLRLQCCSSCAAWAFPYRERCQRCGATGLDWKDASGKATLYGHALLRRVYHPRHEGRLPIVLAQVDTAEGVRMWTNLVDVDDVEISVGMPLQVAFETFPDGGVIPVFAPVSPT